MVVSFLFLFLFLFLFRFFVYYSSLLRSSSTPKKEVSLTLSYLLDKPWSQECRPFSHPSSRRQVLSRAGFFSSPTARRFFISKVAINSRFRAFRKSILSPEEKSPYEHVHSVRIELAKLIVVGTRITYQTTGDAGIAVLKGSICVSP